MKLIFHHFFHKSQASSTKCELNHILIFPNKNVDRKKRSVCTNTWFSWRLSLQKQSKSSGQNSNIYFVCIFFLSLAKPECLIWCKVDFGSFFFLLGTIRSVGRCDQHRLVEKKIKLPPKFNYTKLLRMNFSVQSFEKKIGLFSKHSMVCSIWPKI